MTELLKDLFSKNFDRVNKQEKYLSSERQKIDQMSREIEALRKDAEAFRSLKGKNPFDILENFGVTYEKLVEADKDRNRDPYMQQQMKELKELKEMYQEELRDRSRRDHESKEQELLNEIRSISEAKGYDIIHKLGIEDAVYKHIRNHYDTKGEVLEIDDACQTVLKEVTSQFKNIKDSKWLDHSWDGVTPQPTTSKPSLSSEPAKESVSAPVTHDDKIKAELQILRAKRNNTVNPIPTTTPGIAPKQQENIIHSSSPDLRSRAEKIRDLTNSLEGKLQS